MITSSEHFSKMEPCNAVVNVTIAAVNQSEAEVWADCTLFNFITWGVIGSMLSGFGFVGNSLSLAAFQRDRRISATTLLQCLAASDFMLLLTVFLTDSLPYICDYTGTCSNPWNTWPYIRYIWLIVPISHMCSIWFVVLIALNRYYAVCRPHDMRKVWSNKNTAIFVVIVVFVIIAFNMPRFFEYRVVEYAIDNVTTGLKLEETEFGNTTSYKVVYKVMLVNICLVLVPIVLLIALTATILVTLGKRRKTNSKGPLSRGCSDITFVLILVVVMAIFCQTPLAIFHSVRYSEDYCCGDVVFFLDNISKLLVNFNSSVNFVIYCLFSKKFRKLLLRVICFHEGRANRLELFSTTLIRTRSQRENLLKSVQKHTERPPGP